MGLRLRKRGRRRFGLSRWSYGTSFVFLSEAATVGDGEFWFVLFIGHRDVMLPFEFLKLRFKRRSGTRFAGEGARATEILSAMLASTLP